MYKVLLCWRYLLTRYLALACIVSIMLGVATLIVVNSVMSGFSTKLKERLHGFLSDVVVESTMQEGFADPQEKMERIRRAVGELPDRQREVVLMHRFAEMEHRQIASQLRCSLPAVKSLLNRAYTNLRTSLTEIGLTA